MKSAESIRELALSSTKLAEKWYKVYTTYIRQSNPNMTEDEVIEMFNITSNSIMDLYDKTGRLSDEHFGDFLTSYMSYYEKLNTYYERFGERVVGFVNPTKSRYLP